MISDVVLVAIIGGIVTIASAVIGGLILILKHKLDKVSMQVDGRLTELLELTKKSSHAEGMKDEKETIKPK